MKLDSDRRQFFRLALGAVLIVPAGRFLVACGESDEDYGTPGPTGGADAPAAPPRASGTGVLYTTSSVLAHFHTFMVEGAALSSPPAAGVQALTSDVGHAHSVAISMAQLASVATGATVKVTTGTADGHQHVLTLVKLSAGASAGDGGEGGGGGGGGGGGYPY